MKKIVLLLLCLLCLGGCKKKEVNDAYEESPNIVEEEKEITIVDVNSNERPLAVVINNTPVAVKVQEGLQQAYMVYVIPTEGNTSRLMAFYKGIDDLKIGTIRSARHNFLDYVFEQDAIFVHWGWSHYAKDQIESLGVNNLNGLYDSSFWRENPEGLATEHTAYTSIKKAKELAQAKGYSLTTDKGLVLNYTLDDVNLNNKENFVEANTVSVSVTSSTGSSYTYDSENKVYKRSVNGNAHIDYATKKQITAKNIIIQKINTGLASDHYYWDLQTIGSGDGVYIVDGYAIKIKWSKEDRISKTKYTYLDGSEVLLEDGNTFIELQSNNNNYVIE